MSRRNRRNQRGWQNRRPPKRQPIFTNRRNPQSSWVTLNDVITNVKERVYGWFHRIPKGSRLYWRGGKIVGHSTKAQ